VWDSFADVTFGGVVSGFTQGYLGKVALNGFQATLNSPGVSLTAFYSFTNSILNKVIVQGADGNFYGVLPYDSYDPYVGQIGDGSIYQVTPSGSFTTLYSFGSVINTFGTPLDGANPDGLVLGTDGNFYGTTQNGGYVTNVV